MSSLSIGQLANAAGVGVDTVRFYERAGLLRTPARSASGYRRYAEADVARLRFIRRGKALGFSLDEIAELLRLNDGHGRRGAVRELAARRLAETEQKLRELSAIKSALTALVQRCHGEGDLAGCPIIDAVLGSESTALPTRRRSKA